MGLEGKFADISAQDFMRFADRHGIFYAKKVMNEIKNAIAKWPHFAEQAGLPKAPSDEINIRLNALIYNHRLDRARHI